MDNLIHGFKIISKTALDEMQAEGILAQHCETGLEVYHIHNDDSENLFAFAFMTPPENSSGVAHILEHSVLCGSKNRKKRSCKKASCFSVSMLPYKKTLQFTG